MVLEPGQALLEAPPSLECQRRRHQGLVHSRQGRKSMFTVLASLREPKRPWEEMWTHMSSIFQSEDACLLRIPVEQFLRHNERQHVLEGCWAYFEARVLPGGHRLGWIMVYGASKWGLSQDVGFQKGLGFPKAPCWASAWEFASVHPQRGQRTQIPTSPEYPLAFRQTLLRPPAQLLQEETNRRLLQQFSG